MKTSDDAKRNWRPRWALAGLVFARLVSLFVFQPEPTSGQNANAALFDWAHTVLLLAVNAGFLGVVLHGYLRRPRVGGERAAIAVFACALLARILVLSIPSADQMAELFPLYLAAKKLAGPAEVAAWVFLVFAPLARRSSRGHPLGVAALGLVGFGLGWSLVGAPSAFVSVPGDGWIYVGRELGVLGWLLLGFEWRSRPAQEPRRWLLWGASATTIAIALAAPIAAVSALHPASVSWIVATLAFALWAAVLSLGTRDAWAPTLGAALGAAALAGGAAFRLLADREPYRTGMEAWGFDAHADVATAVVVILTAACAAAVPTRTRPAVVFGVCVVIAAVQVLVGDRDAARLSAIALTLAAVALWGWRQGSTLDGAGADE